MYCHLWSQYINVWKLFKGGKYSRAETIWGNTVFELPWRIPDDLLFPWYRGIDERHGEKWRMDLKTEKYFFRQNLRLWYCCYSYESLRPVFGPFFWHLQFFMRYFIKSSSFNTTDLIFFISKIYFWMWRMNLNLAWIMKICKM